MEKKIIVGNNKNGKISKLVNSRPYKSTLKGIKDRFIIKLAREKILHISDENYLKKLYKIRCNKELNLKDPKTFNEKLQWLKLYDRRPIYTTMVDKYEVKKYVAKIIGEEYIIPTLGVWNKFEDIDFDNLPNQFVIKCTHDSGGIVICKDKSKLDFKKAKEKINKHLKENYYYPGREWAYKNVKPRIIVEKYIKDKNKQLNDYKIFNFDGKSYMIQVDFDRFTNHKRNLYTTNWEYINMQIQYPTYKNYQIKKPEKLELMLELAQKLSKGYPHIRTDFYYVDNHIYFGELTLYHGSGFERIEPEEYNLILGDMIKLPNKGDMKA